MTFPRRVAKRKLRHNIHRETSGYRRRLALICDFESLHRHVLEYIVLAKILLTCAVACYSTVFQIFRVGYFHAFYLTALGNREHIIPAVLLPRWQSPEIDQIWFDLQQVILLSDWQYADKYIIALWQIVIAVNSGAVLKTNVPKQPGKQFQVPRSEHGSWHGALLIVTEWQLYTLKCKTEW